MIEAQVGQLNLNRTTNGASSRLPFGGMNKSGNDRPFSALCRSILHGARFSSLEDSATLYWHRICPRALNFEFKD